MDASVMLMLTPVLTPHGLLTLRQTGEALALEPERARGWSGRLEWVPGMDCCAWALTS